MCPPVSGALSSAGRFTSCALFSVKGRLRFVCSCVTAGHGDAHEHGEELELEHERHGCTAGRIGCEVIWNDK